MRLIALALAVFSVALVAGCGLRPGYPPNPMLRPTAVTDFATLYKQNCAACHGQNGQNGPSIDLANPEYQALVDDASLRKWISGGMPGTEMPAFAQSAGGMLTGAQVDALIAGMRGNWRRPNAFDGVSPPPYTQAGVGDPARGQLTYQARCAQCHEPTRNSANQQITGPRYLALVGDQALRTIIIAGRPDIGQPDWRHDSPGGQAAAPLSAVDVDNIVAYLGSLRNLGQPAAAITASSHTTPAGR